MRPFELLLTVQVAASFVALAFSRRDRLAYLLPFAAAALTALQLLNEGYRWQMVPLYVLVAGLTVYSLVSIWRKRSPTPSGTRRQVIVLMAGLVLTGLGAILPLLLPVPHAPAPTGLYPVGTFSIELVDDSRRELYSGDPSEPRRFMVQFWYPAEPGPQAVRAAWIDAPQVFGPALSGYLHFPDFFLDHLRYVHTDSYVDAPVSSALATYPVLLYNHGWSGFRQQDTSLMQELASQGYVVVSIEHTYSAIASVFPDGTVAYKNPEALPSGLPDDEYFTAANLLVQQWEGDIAFTLDSLERMNNDGSVRDLQGRLELERVGVFGHSFGGGAAVQFCAHDPRCAAGVGLDAYVIPVEDAILDGGLAQPFLFLFSEIWTANEPDNMARFERILAQSPQAQVYTILGTGHYDFTDLPMMSPVAAQLGLKGPLDGGTVIRIINEYALSLFDETLRGIRAAPPEYPEVIVP